MMPGVSLGGADRNPGRNSHSPKVSCSTMFSIYEDMRRIGDRHYRRKLSENGCIFSELLNWTRGTLPNVTGVWHDIGTGKIPSETQIQRSKAIEMEMIAYERTQADKRIAFGLRRTGALNHSETNDKSFELPDSAPVLLLRKPSKAWEGQFISAYPVKQR